MKSEENHPKPNPESRKVWGPKLHATPPGSGLLPHHRPPRWSPPRSDGQDGSPWLFPPFSPQIRGTVTPTPHPPQASYPGGVPAPLWRGAGDSSSFIRSPREVAPPGRWSSSTPVGLILPMAAPPRGCRMDPQRASSPSIGEGGPKVTPKSLGWGTAARVGDAEPDAAMKKWGPGCEPQHLPGRCSRLAAGPPAADNWGWGLFSTLVSPRRTPTLPMGVRAPPAQRRGPPSRCCPPTPCHGGTPAGAEPLGCPSAGPEPHFPPVDADPSARLVPRDHGPVTRTRPPPPH